MNTVYKWIPYDYWQTTEYESWLKEQAASGLEIQHARKYWGRFKKCSSKQVEYRISISKTRLDEEGMTDLDWIEVDKNSDFTLYRSSMAKSNSALYRYKEEYLEDVTVRKKQHAVGISGFKLGIGLIIGFFLLLFILKYIVMQEKVSVIGLVKGNNSNLGFLLFVYGVGFYRDKRAINGLNKLQSRIEEGDLSKGQKPRTVQKIIYILLQIMMIALFFTTLNSIFRDEHKLPLGDTELPIVSLVVLEEDSHLVRDTEDEKYKWINSYSEYGSIFAKRMYQADERGYITGREDKQRHRELKQEFYELSFKGMAEPLAQELMDKHGYREAFKELKVSGLDKAYVVQNNRGIQLVAIKNNRVLYLEYRGDVILEELLEEVVRKIIL